MAVEVLQKDLFKREFSYLFQGVDLANEIKLDEYQLNDLLNTQGELLRLDLDSFEEQTPQNCKVVLINFFADTLEHQEMMKFQERVDAYYDFFDEDTIVMWCTTRNQFNYNKVEAEVFVVQQCEG